MRKKTRPAHLVLSCLLSASLFLFDCSGSSTNPGGPNGPEQKLGATPSPSPSPTGNPSPSPTPSGSPSPSPSPSASPSPPASDVPFDVFFIEKAEVELDRGAGDHRFEVRGSFSLGMASDGMDLTNNLVFVKLDGFEQMLPAGSFERHDEGFRFEADSAGIERLDIDDNGEYRVEARDLDLGNIMLPSEVNFILRIGSDFGEWDIPFDSDGRFENPDPRPSPSPSPSASPSPSPSPTVSPSPSPSPSVSPSPSPSPSPSVSPSPSPSPTTSPSPSPSPTVSPSPSPSPTVSPSPSPSPTVSPSPSPSPTVSPSPSPSPTVSPSPSPSPTVSPSPSPSPTVSPSPSPSPEVHVSGAIQTLVVSDAHSGEVAVTGIRFVVTASTTLEDDAGNDITLNDFQIGQTVDAWGASPSNNRTEARRIRKR